MEEKQIQDDLASIRSLMERSSKFISLSGLSGILAGVYALIGAVAAHLIIVTSPNGIAMLSFFEKVLGIYNRLFGLLIIAIIVLIASLVTGYFLTKRKAKRNGQAIWGAISRSLLFYMTVPLVSGGAFILVSFYRGDYDVILPASLIFYGLSLVSASNFTFTMVKYLGLCEIVLGLIAACLPGYGLLFWATGFGVLHIVYGSMMYLKYDR